MFNGATIHLSKDVLQFIDWQKCLSLKAPCSLGEIPSLSAPSGALPTYHPLQSRGVSILLPFLGAPSIPIRGHIAFNSILGEPTRGVSGLYGYQFIVVILYHIQRPLSSTYLRLSVVFLHQLNILNITDIGGIVKSLFQERLPVPGVGLKRRWQQAMKDIREGI